jgi:hypothetical protein
MVLKEIMEEIDFKTDVLVYKFKNDGALMSTGAIISLVIGVVIMAALLPTAMTSINGANTSGWDATQISIWGILGLIILATVVMKVTE